MTGLEIKRAAENYVDEAIDDLEAVDAINAALSKIGDIAIIYDTVSITDDVGKQWMDLPATTTYVVEVLDSQGEPYDAWRIRDSMIQLKDPGTYTIHYRRLPEPIGGILDTPEVHPAYHNCLVTYVIGWWKLKDDDESPDGLRHMQQFDAEVMRVFNTLRRRQGPSEIVVIR